MAILRWPKFTPGTPLDRVVAKLNEIFAGNDHVMVGGDRAHTALDASAALTTNVTDSATIAGKPALGVAVTYAAEFMETFDTEPASWLVLSGTKAMTLAGTGQTGGKALRQTGPLTMAFPYALPYDASKLHRLRTRAKNQSGTGAFSFGLQAINAAGAVLGTYPVCASSAVPGGSYVEYTGWVKGFGGTATPAPVAASPSALPSGTVSIRPYVVLNAGAPSGVTDLDYVSYERQDEDVTQRAVTSLIPATDPRYAGGARLQPTVIDETAMRDASISSRCVQTNVVITGAVVSLDDPTIFLDLRTGLAPTAYVFSHPAFTLRMNGTASFSGALNAATGTFAGDISAASGTFGGTVSASTFTAPAASFSGNLGVSGQTHIVGNLLVDAIAHFQTADFAGTTTFKLGSTVTFLSGLTSSSAAITSLTVGSTSSLGSASASSLNVSTLNHTGSALGFYGAGTMSKPTITGSRGGNAALADLLLKLAALGLITDSTT